MRKEIPILFSTAMVQAILAGRKAMTRRIIDMDDLKENPDRFRSAGDSREWEVPRPAIKYDDRIWFAWELQNSNARTWIERCKYKPGDLLYVRENWQMKGWSFEDGNITVKYATGETLDCDCPDPTEDSGWLLNQVERLESGGYIIPDKKDKDRFVFTDKKQPMKPGIHLPKDCSRIWLEVTNVRAERLKNISPNDACDEGVEYWNVDAEMMEGGELVADFKNYMWIDDESHEDYHFPTYANSVDSFFSLWKSINGKESLEANPWVWVVSFKVLSTTGKPAPLPPSVADGQAGNEGKKSPPPITLAHWQEETPEQRRWRLFLENN